MERILLLLILSSTRNRDKSGGLASVSEYINNMEINPNYTEEKITLARKIAPLMPVEYINPINRSISITESLMRIMELRAYMNTSTTSAQMSPIPIENNKERISKIISVIQEEVPRSNMNNIGPVLELIVNMDKYKRMFDIFNTLMKNQNINKDADKLIKMVEPMMKSNNPAGGDGTLDIEKIMNVMNLLNKNKDKSDHKDNKNFTQNKDLNKDIEDGKLDIKENASIKMDFEEDVEVIDKKEKPKKI